MQNRGQRPANTFGERESGEHSLFSHQHIGRSEQNWNMEAGERKQPEERQQETGKKE